MKACTAWSYAPYAPLMWNPGEPYVCRIAPFACGFTCQWLPASSEGEYIVRCAPRGEALQEVGRTKDCAFTLRGLEDHRDYAFQISRGDRASRLRLVRTGEAVGTVVNYLHPQDDCYSFSGSALCSPSLLRLPDGALLASMDVFASAAPQNLTLIFRSEDDGRTWNYACELMPCFWGRLFFHRGAVYMLACSTEYGDLLIARSDDGGRSFCAPTALLRGAGRVNAAGVHKNPQPPVYYAGRLWETLEWGAWALGGHAAMVMSAPENADLLDPASWVFSEPLPYDPAWPGTAQGPSAGCIEGCLTIDPRGQLVNVMRYDMRRCTPNYGRALVFRVDTDHPENPLIYQRAMAFPGNHSKFEIRRDAASGRYFSIVSRILDAENSNSRNLLSLITSRDLSEWSLVCDLQDFRREDPAQVGFQYVDFFFEGDDLVYLCRTALNGAHNYHDANYSTFHRLSHFRDLL